MVFRLYSWALWPTWLCVFCWSPALGDLSNLPPGYVIAKNTISPSHRFAFTAPEQDVFVSGNAEKEHNQLIDQNSGKVIASIVGEPGCIEEWKGGILNPWWSKDESIVVWSTVNRSFQGAFVVLKMKDGKLLWQLDVMKICSEELQKRLKTYEDTLKEPILFKPGDVNVGVDTDPNYFSGQTIAPVTLPLKLRIEAFPPSNTQIDATLDATILDDGTVKIGEFHISPD